MSARPLLIAAAVLVATRLGAPAAIGADVGAPGSQVPSMPSPAAEKPKKSAAAAVKMVVEPQAMELLKAASDRLAAAQSMKFTAVVSYEHPSQLGPPLVYTLRYDVTMQRPNKLRVILPGDGPASEFYDDGKTMMAFAPTENLTATAEAPPTIDDALKQAYNTAAIYFPFSDLVLADPYAALTEGVILAFHIGPSDVVGGVKTEMVAWANKDVFIQAWIGTDDKLPRRIRAMYAADPLALRHDMELSDWQLDPQVPEDAFTSREARDGRPITFAHPFAAAPAEVKPIFTKSSPKNAAKNPAHGSDPKATPRSQ